MLVVEGSELQLAGAAVTRAVQTNRGPKGLAMGAEVPGGEW